MKTNHEKLHEFIKSIQHFDDKLRELFLGYARYEKLRQLNPRQFSQLYHDRSGESFNALVDKLPL